MRMSEVLSRFDVHFFVICLTIFVCLERSYAVTCAEVFRSIEQSFPGERTLDVTEAERVLWKEAFDNGNVEIFEIRIFDRQGSEVFVAENVGSRLEAIDFPAFREIMLEALEKIPAGEIGRIAMKHPHQYPGWVFDWFPNFTRRNFGNFRSEFSREDFEFVLGAKAFLDRMGIEVPLDFNLVYPTELGRPSVDSSIAHKQITLDGAYSYKAGHFEVSDRVMTRLVEWGLEDQKPDNE